MKVRHGPPQPVITDFGFQEDELQNVEMAEADKEKKVKEDKLKNRAYTGYDDDEFMEGQAGIRRGVLSKYDEDINGPSETVRNPYYLVILRPTFSRVSG